MKYLIILIITLSSLVFSQEKYFIYFIDKGNEQSNLLKKTSNAYREAVQNLSQKAVERRIKNMGEDFITYDDLPIYKNYLDELEKLNIQIVRKLTWFNSVSALLTSEQLDILRELAFVKSIEPVKKLYFKNDLKVEIDNSISRVSDTSYSYGSSFTQMNLSDIPLVHSKNINGKNVIIGMLDSGFDWKFHNSLKDRNVIAEYDFVFDDSVTSNQTEDSPSQDRHGTFSFSILAGFANGSLIGPAFNSSFILAKTENITSETHIEEDNYAAALIWMESKGVDITTGSIGYNIFDVGYSYTYADMDGKTAIVTKACELAFERGVSTFTSAGNEGNNSWGYIIAPADGFNTIAVGASNESGNAASFSSHGPTYDGRIKPEVVAYGVYNYGALAGTIDGYYFSSGTSFAVPIASGIAALLLSAHPHLKNTQIRNIILESSSNSSVPNNQIGYGVISAKNAIEFPNLEKANNYYVLHKTIFDENIDPQSVKFIFIQGDNALQEFAMSKVSEYDYTLTLPQSMIGEIINFSIMYTDSQNVIHNLPEAGNYKFVYGTDIISLNLQIQNPASSYQVSDFFPNPFIPAEHKTVGFNYITNGNELFKILIIDGSGQKVKEVSFVTTAGINNFQWDGYSEQGFLCASGVYYALIQLGGKEYGKKFILLK